MGIAVEIREQLARRVQALFPHLDERQQRLLLGVEARLLGRGGIRAVAQVTGVSETTVRKGVVEVESGVRPDGRVRRSGGGRKPVTEHDPGLLPALLALVEPDERQGSEPPLRWTTKSLRHLSDALTRQGHVVSAPTVGALLRRNGFRLQGTSKDVKGTQPPDRDAQFRWINEQVVQHQATGAPVISVDTRKRRHLGPPPDTGQARTPQDAPIELVDRGFSTGFQPEQSIPYGTHDPTRSTGWVSVGADQDTAVFAVESIRRWWRTVGNQDYPHAGRLLITSDVGSPHSYRHRAWKSELAVMAAETGLVITVCHFPVGTSKWHKIDHRLFSHMTLNRRGRPLTSHEVVVETVAATSGGQGGEAILDAGNQPTGIEIREEHIAAERLEPHPTQHAWNYTLHPY